jgi:hypothetical protein
VDDALALYGVELIGAGEYGQSLVALHGLLLRIYLGGCADPALRKKLLRSGAGLSAFAVIAPVDLLHGANLRLRWSIGRRLGAKG